MLFLKKQAVAFSLVLCVLTAVFSGAVMSADAATDLPAGLFIADQNGVHADAHGQYYIDVRNIQPGDVITKVITIQNLSQNDRSPEGRVPFTLSMATEPLVVSGPVDLLESVKMNLKLDGVTIYEGPSRGNGTPNMITGSLNLGSYAVGDRHELGVTFTADRDMPVHEEKSEADFKWTFYAARAESADPPKTGLFDNWVSFLPLGGILALFIILIPVKKRRDERLAQQAQAM